MNRIWNIFENCAKKYKLKTKDFIGIIHIIDTDGTYISENLIIEDKTASGFVYSETNIFAPNVQIVVNRNQKKSAVMNKISNTPEINNIPYKTYFMSSNLDHVLYNKQNNSESEKYVDAHRFAKKYVNKIPEFIIFISESDFSVKMPYKESWNYIRQEAHSLERHTNLGLCLKDEN